MTVQSYLCTLSLTLALGGLAQSANAGQTHVDNCLPELKCDDTWNMGYYYVEHFCKGSLDDMQLEDFEGLVKNGEMSQWSVEVLLNVYGAMYGYEFKKLKHLNTFFYDTRASRWLPPACLPLIKSKPSAKDMPFKLTKARDSVRKLHDRHFK
jgi:hypothetical protein